MTIAIFAGLTLGGAIAEVVFRVYLWRNFTTMVRRGPGPPPRDPNKEARLHTLLYPYPNKRICYKFIPNINCVANINDVHRFPLRTDSLGYRGPELARPKPEGTFRILGLGDSSMWGWGLAEEDSYIRLFHQAIERSFPGWKIEIMNTAAPGYNTVNEDEIFKELGDGWGWDLVMVDFCLNDTATPGFLQIPRKFNRLDHLYLADLPGYIFGKWYSPKRFIDSALQEFGSGERPPEGGPRVVPEEQLTPELREISGWDNVVKSYGNIAERCRSEGVPLRVFMFPTYIYEDDPNADREPDFDPVKAMLDDLGVAWTDLFPAFRRHTAESGLNTQDYYLVPNMDSHKNKLGSVVVALGLYDDLRPLIAEKLGESAPAPENDPGRAWLLERLAAETAEQKKQPRIATIPAR